MKKLPIRLAAGSGPTFGVDDLSCAAATHLGLWEDEGLDVIADYIIRIYQNKKKYYKLAKSSYDYYYKNFEYSKIINNFAKK